MLSESEKMMRRIMTSDVLKSDVKEKYKALSHDGEHPLVVLIINTNFKDEGWIDYLFRMVDVKNMIEDFKKVLERNFHTVDIITTGSFDMICYVIPKNFKTEAELNKFIDDFEIDVSNFLLSEKYLGEIKKQVDIFTTPFKEFVGFSIGYAFVNSLKDEDIINSINVAFMNAKNRKNLKISFLTEELLKILNDRNLYSEFQPIIDVKEKKVVAYEALIRGPKNSPLHSPYHLFKIANYNDLTVELDRLAREIHLKNFAQHLRNGEKLSLNLGPVTPLFIDEIDRELKKYDIPKENIIWEISERTYVDDFTAFSRIIDFMNSQGYHVAVDDFGAGFTSFKLSFSLNANLVKFDRDLIKDVDKHDFKKTILYKLLRCFYDPSSKLVAEGVESLEEFYELYGLGYRYYQGYLLSKPSPKILSNEEVKNMIDRVISKIDLKDITHAFDMYFRS